MHLIRVISIDDATGDEISTNALKLTFSSIRSIDKGRCEIVYTRYNFLSGFHILYRSHCALEKHKNIGDWSIKNEIVLSWIEFDHLPQLTNLYLSFS